MGSGVIDLLGDLTNPVAVIIDLFILLIVSNWLWKNAFRPGYLAVQGFVMQRERQDTLNEIADHFRPNSGASLWDQIQSMKTCQSELKDDIADIKNLIEVHIADRRRGGRRWSDVPQCEPPPEED